MTINLDESYLTEKFKTADTADKLRSVTTEQIRAAFSDEPMTTVRAENIQRQLLRLADKKEIEELKQMLPLADLESIFPQIVIEARRIKKFPCLLIWPKGKWPEVIDDE